MYLFSIFDSDGKCIEHNQTESLTIALVSVNNVAVVIKQDAIHISPVTDCDKCERAIYIALKNIEPCYYLPPTQKA